MEKSILQNLISKGLSTREIGRELGFSQTNVNHYLRKYGLKTAPIRRNARGKHFYTCLNCSAVKELPTNYQIGVKKYCNTACSGEHQRKLTLADWRSGVNPGYTGKVKSLCDFIRNYLLQKHNYTCTKCGWNKRHPADGLSLCEINHIDGDACNCREENLEVLCPNCHSETYNFGTRNKNSTRYR